MANQNEQRLLIRVGQVVFGVPALASEGILALPAHVTALPGARVDEPGLFHHGNATVALVDLRSKLGLEASGGRVVLARAAGALRGFVVDEVPGFASPEARSAPLPPGLPLRTFHGALLHGERMALLTDFEALYTLAEAGPALRQLAQPAPAAPEAPPPTPHVPLHEALGKVISEGQDRAPPAARPAPPPPPATVPTPGADTARAAPRAAPASRPAPAPTAPVSAQPAPTPRSGASTLSRKPAADKAPPPRPPAAPAKEVLTRPAPPAPAAPAPSPAPKPAHDPGMAPAPRAPERTTPTRTRLLPYAALAALVAGVVVALPFVLSPPREVRAPAAPPLAGPAQFQPVAPVKPAEPPVPAAPQAPVAAIAAIPPEAPPASPASSVRIEATEDGIDVVLERHEPPAPEAPAVAGRPGLPPAPTVRETVSVHTVVRGDTLWDIAARYLNDPWAYHQLAADSRIEDPDIIEIGDEVRVVVREISNSSR
ncbi:MAG: chemotaxis protein CheW [Gammaproteobacteria bacterium]|nr:chemotaxis protein CheW [Gammaproteobacteria bacterium]